MTEETRKLFNAPWSVESMGEVRNAEGYLVSTDGCFAWSPAIVHLPELYDALLQATEDACRTCNHEKAEGILDRPCNDLHSNECYVAQWLELLRKVRDGK